MSFSVICLFDHPVAVAIISSITTANRAVMLTDICDIEFFFIVFSPYVLLRTGLLSDFRRPSDGLSGTALLPTP